MQAVLYFTGEVVEDYDDLEDEDDDDMDDEVIHHLCYNAKLITNVAKYCI